MTTVRVIRTVLVLTGLGLASIGALRLFDLGWANFVAAAVWLGAGVVLHDAVIAPLTILIALGLARVLGARLSGALMVGLIVIGTVSIAAIPVLGRFGARLDNPSLLPRNYVAGWLVFVAVVLVVAIVAGRWAQWEKGYNGGADPRR